MDEPPRTVKTLFAEAKDTSELMLDLGYAALLFDDTTIAEEVMNLAERLADLAHRIREVCLLASRSVADATELAGFLAVTDSITTIGDQAVDIAKIVTKRLELPAAMRRGLADAVEVTDRVAVGTASALDGADVQSAEFSVHAARLLATRRGREWTFDPPDNAPLAAGDVLLVRGSADATAAIRARAGQPGHPVTSEEAPLGNLDRAIDALVEMKNLSELAVTLAYATPLAADAALARQVNWLEDRLDTMRETVETWVLGAADPAAATSLRGLLHLAVAVETIGDAAQAMIWPIERGERLHPVLADALAETEDTVAMLDIVSEAPADGRSIADLDLTATLGLTVIAVAADGRWDYRPQPSRTLQAGNRIILTGPTDSLQQAEQLAGG